MASVLCAFLVAVVVSMPLGGYRDTMTLTSGYVREAKRLVQLGLGLGATDTEYAVYSAALEEWFRSRPQRIPVFAVTESSEEGIPDRSEPGCFSEGRPSVAIVASFRRQNQRSAALVDRFAGTLNCELVTPSDLAQQQLGERMEYVALSRIGFDKARHRAIVHLDHYCGTTCGGGAFIVLERLETDWKVVDGCFTWMG